MSRTIAAGLPERRVISPSPVRTALPKHIHQDLRRLLTHVSTSVPVLTSRTPFRARSSAQRRKTKRPRIADALRLRLRLAHVDPSRSLSQRSHEFLASRYGAQLSSIGARPRKATRAFEPSRSRRSTSTCPRSEATACTRVAHECRARPVPRMGNGLEGRARESVDRSPPQTFRREPQGTFARYCCRVAALRKRCGSSCSARRLTTARPDHRGRTPAPRGVVGARRSTQCFS